MISRFLLLLFCAGICLSAPLAAAEQGSSDVPTTFLSTSQEDDQFDADFDDDFDTPKQAYKLLIADPFEGFNRSVFWFNDKLYFYLLKPVAKSFRLVAPRPARVSINNFLSNLATPARAANSLLQLNFYNFGTELYRFIVNSTVGLGGLFDPAVAITGLKRKNEDFGQTLGYYGAGHGFYLVLPVLGPSSLRDGSGMLVDGFLDPLFYADLRTGEYLAIHAFKMTNWLSLDRDTYEGIIRDAIDPYLFIRAAYAQRRLAQTGETSYDLDTLFDADTYHPLKWNW